MEDIKLIAEFMGMVYFPETKCFREEFKREGTPIRDMATGGRVTIPIIDDVNIHTVDELEYSSKWNLLMPVVEKIQNELGSLANFRIEGGRILLIWFLGGYHDTIYKEKFGEKSPLDLHEDEEDMKDAIYKAVVVFIKWYNENK